MKPQNDTQQVHIEDAQLGTMCIFHVLAPDGMKMHDITHVLQAGDRRRAPALGAFKARLFSDSPSLSESESSRGGMRTRICRRSLWTTSCSFPLDFSISFPASCRERFSVTVPLIYTHAQGIHFLLFHLCLMEAFEELQMRPWKTTATCIQEGKKVPFSFSEKG